MISNLRISNYALIREIEIDPQEGLNIITGETGAGKSIILGALSLLQGHRADPKVVKNSQEKSVVEARFELSETLAKAIEPQLKEADAPIYDDYCILHREIAPSGRSRAFINDSPVTLNVLQQVADRLIDIHSQHKNLLIADGDFQRQVLDNLASNDVLLSEYHGIYAEYRQALRRFTDARDAIERTRSDVDYLQYQLDELQQMKLKAGEDNELEAQRNELASSSEIAGRLGEAATAMSLGEQNVSTLTATALDALQRIAEFDPEYQKLAERLYTVHVELTDIADTLTDKASILRDDPAALEQAENRLSRINSLKSKHKVDSVDELIAICDNLADRLAQVANADKVLETLEHQARVLKRRALEAATNLSNKRKEAAAKLKSTLEERATPLGLSNLVCEIAIETGKLNPNGIDTVDYRFAFNKNQTPLPIGSTASGGEISRVMLALKSILAEHINLPTIIFDEIDTGVSGDVANRMGALMASIGKSMQVIAITHLPQVAACGTSHFKVFKRDNDESTETSIISLSPKQRRHELALMLSGDPDEPSALATADKLLNN